MAQARQPGRESAVRPGVNDRLLVGSGKAFGVAAREAHRVDQRDGQLASVLVDASFKKPAGARVLVQNHCAGEATNLVIGGAGSGGQLVNGRNYAGVAAGAARRARCCGQKCRHGVNRLSNLTHDWSAPLGPDSIAEIAAAEKINESYVGRVLRLTLLAPDIVEAVLNGRSPVVCCVQVFGRRRPTI